MALEDSLTTSPAGFTADGKTLYWIDSRGRNTAALIAQDVVDGQHDGARREPQGGHQRHADQPQDRFRSKPIAPNI